MIRYDLLCSRDHGFEAWFGSSADFDTQAENGLVACPICGDTEIRKAIMAPAVKTSKADAPDLAALAARLQTHIATTCEDVGTDFAEEARAIHAGDKPPRGIYGAVSPQDARKLAEDGVPALPLPDAIAPRPKRKVN